MEEQILYPRKQELKIKGRVSYRESYGAWNTIRFKKELISEFPMLKEKSSLFGYELIFYRTHKEFEKAFKKMKKSKLPPPLLLWFYKIKKP